MQHSGIDIFGDRSSDTDYADDIAAIGADLLQLTGTLASLEGARAANFICEDQDPKHLNRPISSEYHGVRAAGQRN